MNWLADVLEARRPSHDVVVVVVVVVVVANENSEKQMSTRATSPVCPGFPKEPLRSLTQSIHFLSYLVFSKPNIPISSLDFDSHPPSRNQISPRVD